MRLVTFRGAGGAIAAAALILAATATPAVAYIGPGLGLGVITSIFGAIAAFFMMIAGLIWYPIKSLLRKRRGAQTVAAQESAVEKASMQESAEAKSGD